MRKSIGAWLSGLGPFTTKPSKAKLLALGGMDDVAKELGPDTGFFIYILCHLLRDK